MFRFERVFFNGVDVVMAVDTSTFKFDGLANDEWEYINDSTTAVNFSSTLCTVFPNGTVYTAVCFLKKQTLFSVPFSSLVSHCSSKRIRKSSSSSC